MKKLSRKELFDVAKELEKHGKMIDEAKKMLSDNNFKSTPEGRAKILNMIATVRKHHDRISAALNEMDQESRVGGSNIKRKIG